MNLKEQYFKNANSFIKEDDEVFSKERIEKIRNEAIDAFWEKVAKLIPESTTGDLDPMTVKRLDDTADVAIRAWINYNVTGDPVM
jgi:hypothetical protein